MVIATIGTIAIGTAMDGAAKTTRILHRAPPANNRGLCFANDSQQRAVFLVRFRAAPLESQ